MRNILDNMENKVKELGIFLTRTNILIEWKDLPKEKQLIQFPSEEAKAYEEAKYNQCCKILAVGDEVKNMKPGQYALMGGTGRLLTINGTVYGIIKEHMVDAVFNSPPVIGKDEGKSQGGILTKVTEREIQKFNKKHNL